MKLPLDECIPKRLRREFIGHEVFTIEQAGFKGLKNGALLRRAAEAGFGGLVTADKGIEYQQNINDLPIAVLILSAKTNRYESLIALIPHAMNTLREIGENELVKIED